MKQIPPVVSERPEDLFDIINLNVEVIPSHISIDNDFFYSSYFNSSKFIVVSMSKNTFLNKDFFPSSDSFDTFLKEVGDIIDSESLYIIYRTSDLETNNKIKTLKRVLDLIPEKNLTLYRIREMGNGYIIKLLIKNKNGDIGRKFFFYDNFSYSEIHQEEVEDVLSLVGEENE